VPPRPFSIPEKALNNYCRYFLLIPFRSASETVFDTRAQKEKRALVYVYDDDGEIEDQPWGGGVNGNSKRLPR